MTRTLARAAYAAALLMVAGSAPAADRPIPHRSKPAFSADHRSERLLALTIWAEARSRGPVAMASIGHVVINRAQQDSYGHGIAGVLWKRGQFGCWRPRDPNRRAMRNIASLPRDGADWRQWVQAKQIAHGLLHEQRHDPTRGATYYAGGRVRPGWTRRMQQVALLGGHRFYRLLTTAGARSGI